jgi:glycosyltransferase involved in cell wall biosynthesis
MPFFPTLPLPRRILMTADTVGGVWTYALDLARALAERGVAVSLATMGARLTRGQWEEARAAPRLEVFASAYRLEWMAEPWEDVARAGKWLRRLEEQVRPDVVHLNGYAHAALPWCAPTVVVGHSCVLSWWEAVHGEAAPPEWDRYRAAVRRGLRAADLVVAPSGAMLEALERHYGPLPAVRVIPNGRHPSLFAPGAKEELVLSVGRLWDQAKNTAALAAVARELPWPVYLAGEEKHPDGGAARHDGVRLLGRLTPPELAPWFARAAVYALPARYEPFGLSALEAALAGCALVLGDIPSLREVWGDAAVFVPPDDTAALREALLGLMRDGERRSRLAARARARAQRYTPGRMADGYLGAYRELLEEGAAAGARVAKPQAAKTVRGGACGS